MPEGQQCPQDQILADPKGPPGSKDWSEDVDGVEDCSPELVKGINRTGNLSYDMGD